MPSSILISEQGTDRLNIGDDSQYHTYDVTGKSMVGIFLANNSGVTWSAGRLAVEFSNIGDLWGDLPDGAVTPYSSVGYKAAITLNGLVRRMRIRVSTENASSATIQLCVMAVNL